MLSALKTIAQTVVSPIANAYQSKQERKRAYESGKAKLLLAKENNDSKHDLTNAEWEAQGKKDEKGSWKDEYVTIIITLPIPLLFISSMVSSWTGDMRYVEAVNAGIENLKALGMNYGDLIWVVVLAAVSIKGYGVLKK